MNRSMPELGLLELQRLLIQKRLALPRTMAACDLFDLDTKEQVGVARETLGAWISLLRRLVGRKLGPARIEVCETEDESLVFTIRRPAGPWRQRVEVYDADDHRVGYFKSRLFARGGSLWVYDSWDRLFAEVRGAWAGWTFTFVAPDGRELGAATRPGAGLGRGLAAAAGDYVVAVADELEDQPIAKMLLLAAALAIDMVYDEGKY
jgi:hypothetical protein